MPSFLRNVSGGTSVASWKQPKRQRNDTGQVATYWTAGVLGLSVEYLLIAGGGGGGFDAGGGGGAGGYVTGTLNLINATITIGNGGAYNTDGNNSIFAADSLVVTAIGGGSGRSAGQNGNSGGSGGGSGYSAGLSGGASTQTSPTGGTGFGNVGGSSPVQVSYSGGGGGGAGGAGSNNNVSNGLGGAGLASSITGASVTRAGGGGAGWFATAGGSGGGGTGGGANNGTVNTGSGGGGGGASTAGGSGGSGIFILRYPDSQPAASATTGSPTITVSGGYRIYNFTGSGSITF